MISLCIFIATLLFVASIFFLLPMSAHRNKMMLVVLTSVFSVTTIGMYFVIGNAKGYQDFLFAQSHQAQIAQATASLHDPNLVIGMIKNRLATQPDDAKGWYLLGRLYFSQQDLPHALDAFTHAEKLQPDNFDVAYQMAQTLYFSHQAHLTVQARHYLERVLQHDADSVDALNLLAVAAYRDHDYASAIGYWEHLLRLFPAGSDDAKTLVSAIANAQKLLQKSQA